MGGYVEVRVLSCVCVDAFVPAYGYIFFFSGVSFFTGCSVSVFCCRLNVSKCHVSGKV